jgi:hypothetical protein
MYKYFYDGTYIGMVQFSEKTQYKYNVRYICIFFILKNSDL